MGCSNVRLVKCEGFRFKVFCQELFADIVEPPNVFVDSGVAVLTETMEYKTFWFGL